MRTVKAILELNIPVAIYNQWGPSETTVQTSSHQVSRFQDSNINIPIGKPIQNCSHYIVDRNLRPVPAPVVGEICVGGAQVGIGYSNRPEATDEVFIENPFASNGFINKGWTRLYRTGDLGCFMSNGELEFKGRISGDRQIKLRGYRIDIAEIENEIVLAMKRLSLSRDVELRVLPRGVGSTAATDDRQLIAFIAVEKTQKMPPHEHQTMADAIHRALGVTLNSYMLPSGYCFMNFLPKLISGKVDNQNLLSKPSNLTFPSINSKGSIVEHDEATAMVEKDSEILQVVKESFKEVLNLPADQIISGVSNFFDLGGQSILLMRLQAQLRRKLKVQTPLLELFAHPTPIGVTFKILGKSIPDEQYVSGIVSSAGVIDWNAESRLPHDPRYEPSSAALPSLDRSEISGILIVGAETSTGVHCLKSLLHSSNKSTTIYVMGSEEEICLTTLVNIFEQHHLFTENFTSQSLTDRVQCLPGSLHQSRFGLSHERFVELGKSVQMIYHLGGQVSLLKTYSDLKRVNVGSVLDIIELASLNEHSKTDIQYLSTWSVLHLQSWEDTQRSLDSIDITERLMDHFQPGGQDSFGYFKSKWVAEILLGDAAKRGFAVNLYRSSALITGETNDKATSSDNFALKMVTGMVQSGKAPRFPGAFDIDFVPVDYLAESIVSLSLAGDITHTTRASPSCFHIASSSPLALKDLPAVAGKLGKNVSLVDPGEWIYDMQTQARSEEERIEWSVLKAYIDLGHRMFSLQCTKTRDQIARLEWVGKAENPPVDEKLIARLLGSGIA